MCQELQVQRRQEDIFCVEGDIVQFYGKKNILYLKVFILYYCYSFFVFVERYLLFIFSVFVFKEDEYKIED